MGELKIETPSEKQRLFLTAQKKYVGYGGARGGGKSWAVRTKAKLLALNYAGIRILIVRRTYPELLQNHTRILRAELTGIATYTDKDKIFTFRNGSTIALTYCANDGDLQHVQGVEFDVIFIDEATQLSEYQIKAITACVRGVNSFPKRVYLTCNPGGQGHGYIKRIFIDKAYNAGENPDDYMFIQATVHDNAALMKSDPEYVEQLKALPPKLREAWYEGKWDIYDGQFFADFRNDPSHYLDRKWTHVIAPFDIPSYWTCVRGLDWGYNKPFSCGYFFISGDGVMYHALEYYGWNGRPNEGCHKNPETVFAEIQQLEREHPLLRGRHIIGIADPAIWNAERGESIADTAARYQVYFTPGDHQRIPGWMMCHNYLQFSDEGYPRFYVFKTCKNFIRTIPLLLYDEHKPEDLNTEGEDHIADAWRYVTMSYQVKPILKSPAKDFYTDPLYMYLDIGGKKK